EHAPDDLCLRAGLLGQDLPADGDAGAGVGPGGSAECLVADEPAVRPSRFGRPCAGQLAGAVQGGDGDRVVFAPAQRGKGEVALAAGDDDAADCPVDPRELAGPAGLAEAVAEDEVAAVDGELDA